MGIYHHLSLYYNSGWLEFTKQYALMVQRICNDYHLARARILDIACGTGILAVELARKGHFVHGVDISPEMIAVAKANTRGMNTLSFEVQDMRKLQVEGNFDLATCSADSLNYLMERQEVKDLFHSVATALKPSGLFVFDSTTHQHYLKTGKGSRKRTYNGETFTQEWYYDKVKKKSTVVFEFPDGYLETHYQRSYNLPELIPLLREAGLTIEKAFSDLDDRPYSARSARLICVARKSA